MPRAVEFFFNLLTDETRNEKALIKAMTERTCCEHIRDNVQEHRSYELTLTSTMHRLGLFRYLSFVRES